MGGTHPSSLPPDHDWSQIVQDYIKTIPTFLAFLKLLLGHVKVKIMLISWYFLVVFLDAPPPAHWFTPSFLRKRKVLRWYISGPSLTCMWLVIPEFSNFKCYQRKRKYDLRLILGRFLVITPQNGEGEIGLKCWPVKQFQVGNDICYNFNCTIKKWWKFSQKTIFRHIFRGFRFEPSYTLWVTPQFLVK